MSERSLILPKPLPNSKNWLLVIGIDQYQDVGIPPLSNAVRDATNIADMLAEKYGFETDRQTRLFDVAATRAAIFQALQMLANKVSPNDNVVIYFAGHGWYSRRDEIGYLIPVDARKGEEDSYFENTTLINRVRAIRSQHIFLVLDSCFSGSLLRDFEGGGVDKSLEKLAESPSRWALTAGRIEAVEDGFHGSNSPFAQAVLRFLDKEAPAAFAISDLIHYVKRTVPRNANQLPHAGVLFKTGDLDGEMVLIQTRREAQDWAAAEAENTVAVYETFVAAHPDSEHAPTARTRIRTLREAAEWQHAHKKKDTVAAYTQFLRDFPNSDHAEQARARCNHLEEEAAWKDAKRRDTLAAYEDFTQRFPESHYRDEANSRTDAILRKLASEEEVAERDSSLPKAENPSTSVEPIKTDETDTIAPSDGIREQQRKAEQEAEQKRVAEEAEASQREAARIAEAKRKAEQEAELQRLAEIEAERISEGNEAVKFANEGAIERKREYSTQEEISTIVKKLIASSKILDAIECLEIYLKNANDNRDDIIHIASRYSSNEKRYTIEKRISLNKYEIELAGIRSAILDLLPSLPDQSQVVFNFASVDFTAKSTGKVLYNIPSRMQLNIPYTCNIRIIADYLYNEIIKNIEEEEKREQEVIKTLSEDAKAEKVKIEKIKRVTEAMSVTLKSLEEGAFEIKSITSVPEQEIVFTHREYTEWFYQVKPLRAGNHILILEVYVYDKSTKSIKTLEKTVSVGIESVILSTVVEIMEVSIANVLPKDPPAESELFILDEEQETQRRLAKIEAARIAEEKRNGEKWEKKRIAEQRKAAEQREADEQLRQKVSSLPKAENLTKPEQPKPTPNPSKEGNTKTPLLPDEGGIGGVAGGKNPKTPIPLGEGLGVGKKILFAAAMLAIALMLWLIPDWGGKRAAERERQRQQHIMDSIAQVKNDSIQKVKADSVARFQALPLPIQALVTGMKLIPAGTFQMGSNENDDEKPIHSVTVSGFYMSETEVTQAQYKAIMEKNPSNFKNCDQCPVENVNWNDVQAFIRNLNALTGQQYRLPTEAEWEYAARGGEAFTYAGSNTPDAVAWHDGNSGSKTHPVKSKKPNAYGLYDMSGNVWEWCSDWFKGYPGSTGVSDYTGSDRVFRGGGWYDDPRLCRVAYRDGYSPTDRYYSLGFRVVRLL